MMAGRIPNPDPQRSGHEDVALLIDTHPIWNSIVRRARLCAELATVRQRAAWEKIVNADVPSFAIVHVKMPAVGRERQSIRLFDVPREETKVAFRIQAIDALIWDLLYFSLGQIQSGIGEVDCAVRTDRHVVGAIEFLVLISVGENRVA